MQLVSCIYNKTILTEDDGTLHKFSFVKGRSTVGRRLAAFNPSPKWFLDYGLDNAFPNSLMLLLKLLLPDVGYSTNICE